MGKKSALPSKPLSLKEARALGPGARVLVIYKSTEPKSEYTFIGRISCVTHNVWVHVEQIITAGESALKTIKSQKRWGCYSGTVFPFEEDNAES